MSPPMEHRTSHRIQQLGNNIPIVRLPQKAKYEYVIENAAHMRVLAYSRV